MESLLFRLVLTGFTQASRKPQNLHLVSTFSNTLTKIRILKLIITKTWGEILITKEEHEYLKSEHVMGCSQTCCHVLSLAHSLALE